MTHTLNSNNNNVDEPWSASINKTGNQHLIRSSSAVNNIEDDLNEEQQEQTTVHDSSLSIYERLRHFLYFNFVLNKRSFVLAILGYLSDLVLFLALSLYLFSKKKFMYEFKCTTPVVSVETTTPIKSYLNYTNETIQFTSLTNDSDLNNINNITTIPEPHVKQSYLTLQIMSLFVFFICFIFSYLIKLQFKYHKLALNLYDYDVDLTSKINSNNQTINNLDRESLASTTTASHFSSSAATNKKISTLIKRALVRLMTKFASILLNLFFGYQFCQNCFIQQSNETYMDAYTIFTHIFIFVCVMLRCFIQVMNKKNSMNKLNHLEKLRQKQKDLFDPANSKNTHRNYYFYYYSYLIKNSQNSCNQLKQHQNNQNTFRIFQIDDMSLFVGFISSLFHLFNFLKAFEICFLFIPIFLTLILFRFKSILNASINLFVIFISLLIISNFNDTNSITNISEIYLQQNTKINSNTSSNSNSAVELMMNKACLNLEQNQNTSSIFNLFSYNLFTFLCFLLTFYFQSLLSIYYCSLTSLERWNISFLCKLSFWRKLSIFITFLIYLIFIVTCTITLCIKFKHWSFLVIPFFFIISFIWCCFELLNTINLTHLMNKISDCYLLLNETNSSSDNTSNLVRKPNHYNNTDPLLDDKSNCSNNRDSTMSHSSSNNNNNNNNNNNSNKSFKLTKFLARFLSYNKLNLNGNSVNQLNSINIPIHRILATKGVRNLGSISYRISLYCFTQTALLAIFTFNTNSPFTIGLYLIALSLNFIWISLLYQFCKSISGNCIAYALVAPPHILNQHNMISSSSASGTYGTTNSSSLSSNPTLFSANKRYRGGGSSTATGSSYTTNGTVTTIGTAATTSSSLMYMPFEYQQAINQRCTHILHKMQAFLQFHLIENYGCDFASNGLKKDFVETKIRNFFQKKSIENQLSYNTYLLYYCGPTSSQTDNISFLDGNELSIEEIINIWKEVHCLTLNNKQQQQAKKDESNSESDSNQPSQIPKQQQQEQVPVLDNLNLKKKNTSRLIIMLDSEHTAKSLEYINSKCIESNVYIALQSAKYNYNNNQKNRKLIDNNKSNSKQTLSTAAATSPSTTTTSPQTLVTNMSDSYLNIGKFTLDWIKSNFCNSNEYFGNEQEEKMNYTEAAFYSPNNNRKEKINELDEEDDDDDDDEDDESDIDDFALSQHKNQQSSTINRNKNNIKSNNNNGKKNSTHKRNSSNVYYEAKCAFSRYFFDFSFNGNQKMIAHDFDQFWRNHYPYFICTPLLKLINCRLFYLRFNVFKKTLFYLRRLKIKLIPIKEFDTECGFKLFSS